MAACVVLVLLMMQGVLAQEDPQSCYTAGSVAGAVVGTLIVTLLLVGLGYLLWRIYWRSRRGKHLVLVTDPEGAGDQYAFDNPCFKDGTPIGRTTMEKEPAKLDQKARWSPWSALVGPRSTDKRRALDDSFIGEPQVNVVSLRSHDFTGLGFNICGNMRDGIFVKDVLHRGPASESGRITPGDRIDSIRISFRHMVFEDALTILSYASPYDVQLEVENASNSRPSTLIRTKRTSGTSIAPADRICHPFYRSQSIADLAQIGKASLKRMQQMGSISKSPRTEQQHDDSGDYPTLKLSTSPTTDGRKENVKIEKTAPPSNVSIVKPERVKRSPTKASPRHENQEFPSQEEEGKDTLNKYQKFGVRVLPDPTTGHRNSQLSSEELAQSKLNVGDKISGEPKRSVIEAEHKQNEHNSNIEKVGEGAATSSNPHHGQRSGISEVDGGMPKSTSLQYDERGIDVGPIEPQRGRPKTPTGRAEEGKHSGEAHVEGNVKHLLTKGFQNLKEKLHHHDKKKNGGTNSDSPIGSDKEDSGGNPSPTRSDIMQADMQKKKQTEEKIQKSDSGASSHEGQIPTEIPEEVRRAAMAARSNRKSSGNVMVEPPTRKRTTSQDAPSGGSSSEGEETRSVGADEDSLGRTPKRPNKRKAPPPPPEEGDEKSTSTSPSPQLESDMDSEGTSNFDKQRLKDNMLPQKPKKHDNPISDENNIQTADEAVCVSTEMKRNPDIVQKEVTSITIEGNTNKPATFETTVTGNKSGEEMSRLEEEAQETKTKPQHMDYDIGVNISSVNSDSDSDLERMEGDNDSYDGIVKGRKAKKGGTTIELNSSHITIHHSPSETVQHENESTRKAASLGDLSRIDTEQPMSILERAVSLDLADGGTPHGSKKRKAPLPPPGEDYLSMPDGDEGIAHRKEPRLDSAMDTFQRRRLKKSSDWGTLEEALMQSDNKTVELHVTRPPDMSEGAVTILKSDSTEVLSKSEEIPDTSILANPERSRITRTDIMNIDDTAYSSILGFGNSGPNSLDHAESDMSQQQKTVLRITPEPITEPSYGSSQVTIASSTFNPSIDTSIAPGDVVSMSRHQPEVMQTFNTKVESSFNSPPSPQNSTNMTGLVSSTPISHSVTTTHNGGETLQSPIVTSSHSGISSIHVVSSTTHDMEPDSSILASSLTDAFITAVDSTTTTLSGDLSKEEEEADDATWGQDSVPPELPTSPVPQLSSFKPSPSMTYITEIQVVTTADSSSNPPVAESTSEEQRATPEITSTVAQRVLKYNMETNPPSDSVTTEAEVKETDVPPPPPSNAPQKGNVSITAIRSTASRIPMRITTDRVQSSLPPVHILSNSLNHVSNTEERRVKPARPPVPPRKSESSSTETGNRIQNRISTEGIHISAPTTSNSGNKFISFSSLAPTSNENGGATRNSTSFEQWVFLDETSTPNGLETTSPTDDSTTNPHSMVVSLPSRTQSITHIVLDSKQSNGNHGKP